MSVYWLCELPPDTSPGHALDVSHSPALKDQLTVFFCFVYVFYFHVYISVSLLQRQPAGRLSPGLLRGHLHAVRLHQPGVAPRADRPRRRPPVAGAASAAPAQRGRTSQ